MRIEPMSPLSPHDVRGSVRAVRYGAEVATTRHASVTVHDLLSNDRFARVRPSLRPLVAEIRKRRRHRVNPRCMVAFENRETVLWQIQEVLRVENRVSPHHAAEELARYEALLPRPGELRATVFIDGGPAAAADALCERLANDPRALELRIDRKSCFAECVEERPELSSPVRYVRFALASAGIHTLELVNHRARLVLHGSRVDPRPLSTDACRALATDLSVIQRGTTPGATRLAG